MKHLLLFIFLSVAVAFSSKAQTQADTNAVFTFVDQMPQFPGGDKALEKFIKEKLKTPDVPKDERKQGRVVAGFIVEKNGSLANIKILKPLGGAYNQAVIDMIKSMPPWVPGKQDDKVVRVRFMLPVDFK